MAANPTAMVVLASEQLWPNIHGLMHWLDELKHLCIYNTADLRHSAEPAGRLAQLCTALAPRVQVHHTNPPLSMQPRDVHAQVRRWQQAVSGQRWLLNATGGNKLMTAGLLRSVGEPDCTVVYREREGDWFELRRGTDNRDLVTEAIDVPAAATDRVPVEDLVRAFWENDDFHVEFAAAPSSLPVLELTRAWIAERGHWSAAFARCGLPSESNGGLLFEKFVTAVLRELGIRNLACNAVRCARDSKQPVQEIDVVANHRGRLQIVDCKLASPEAGYRTRDVEPITTQIRQAADTRRQLGGLGARLLLLRPNVVFQDAERALAEASGLSVLDQEDCRGLFSGLRHFLGVPGELPETLRLAEEVLAKAAERAWSNPMRPPRGDVEDVVAASGQRCVVDLDAFMRAHEQNWVAFRLGADVEFQCTRPEGATDFTWLRLVRARFGRFGSFIDDPPLRISRSGNIGWFRLNVAAVSYRALLTDLEPSLGEPLFAPVPQPMRR